MGARYPQTLRVAESASGLEIDWDDHSKSSLTAQTLREQCRCTECRRIVATGIGVVAAIGVTLKEVRPYGTNAVQLVFSDGHERGVFPFAYLADLAYVIESS